MVPYQEEVVILVHGTFAGDESDDGEKWWQKNSATWKSIASRLPENVRIDQTFHWADGLINWRADYLVLFFVYVPLFL